MEDTTDGNYTHAKKVCEDFKIKHLGEYHDSYVQSDRLLLALHLTTFGMFVLKGISLIPLILFLHED